MSKKEERLMTKGQYIDEKCPLCGLQLIGNNLGEKWCGHLTCDYGIINFDKKGIALTLEKK